MHTLGNIIWFIFGGLVMGLQAIITGIAFTVTIILIPFGLQQFKLAPLLFCPFGKGIRNKNGTTYSPAALMGNVFWVIIIGWYFALLALLIGLLYCITIVGVPFGLQWFKIARLLFLPFGKEIYNMDAEEKMRRAEERKTAGQVPITGMNANYVYNQPNPYMNTVNNGINDVPTKSMEAPNVGEINKPNPSYTELSSYMLDSYCPKSGILLDKITLQKDNSQNAYIKLSFVNLCSQKIAAIFFEVEGFDISGEKIGNKEYNLIDLNVLPDREYISDSILLFDNSIRKVNVILTKVVKASNNDLEVIKLTNEDTVLLPEKVMIRTSDNDNLVELMQLQDDEKYYYTKLEGDMFYCTCGFIGHKSCINCGRAPEDMIENSNESIYRRVSRNVDDLAESVELCNTRSSLEKKKEELEKTIKLLSDAGFDNSLSEKCYAAINEIDEKKEGMNQKKKKRKSVLIKIGIIAAVLAIVATGVFFAVKAIVGMPPSDSTIDNDIKSYLAQCYSDKYEIVGCSKVKTEEQNTVSVVTKIDAEDPDNGDLISVTQHLCYRKYDWKYKLNNQECYHEGFKIYPDHKITEKDDLEPVEFDFYSSEKTQNEKYTVEYAGITYDKEYAQVPISELFETKNARYEYSETFSYKYEGDYKWRLTGKRIVEIKGENSEIITPLDEDSVIRLIGERDIEHDGIKVKGNKLEFESIDTVKYENAYTEAAVNCKVTYEDESVKLSGMIRPRFKYDGSNWRMDVKTFYLSLENAKKDWKFEITDEEIKALVEKTIKDECAKDSDVSNITIESKRETEDGIIVTAEYTSYWKFLRLVYSIELEFKAGYDGYSLKRKSDPELYGRGISKNFDESFEVNYFMQKGSTSEMRLSSTKDSGKMTLNIKINTDKTVEISGKIGDFSFDEKGRYVLSDKEYSNGRIKINSITKKTKVNYSPFRNRYYDKEFELKIDWDLGFDEVGIRGKMTFYKYENHRVEDKFTIEFKY